jgi:hypothetical protein
LFEGAFIDIQIFAHSVKQCSALWLFILSDKSLFTRQFPPILSDGDGHFRSFSNTRSFSAVGLSAKCAR